MRDKVTTTKMGFRVQDITFKDARRQSAIDEELGNNTEEYSDGDIPVPVSFTPEQVINFLNAKGDSTQNMNERKLYKQISAWVDELFKLKKKVTQLEQKVTLLETLGTSEDDESENC